MVNPLLPSAWAGTLKNPLSKDSFRLRAEQIPSDTDIKDFVSLWLGEGAAECFSHAPITFQLLRSFVGRRLGVSSRNVGLTGSGKIGFSLSPNKSFADFDKHGSDLDIFVVSLEWFDRLTNDFNVGMRIAFENEADYSERELIFLNSNRDQVPKNIRRGFIDSNKVPYHRNRFLSRSARRCFLASEKVRNYLREDPHQWTLKRSHIRAYRDWEAAVEQQAISVKFALKNLSTGGAGK